MPTRYSVIFRWSHSLPAEAIAAVKPKQHNFATKQKQLSFEGPTCSFAAICHAASVDRAVLCGSARDSGTVRGGGGASRRLFICDCRVGTLMCNRYWITLLGEDPYFILLLLGSGQCRTLYCRADHCTARAMSQHGVVAARLTSERPGSVNRIQIIIIIIIIIITTTAIISVCRTFVPSVRVEVPTLCHMLCASLLNGLFSPAPTSGK